MKHASCKRNDHDKCLGKVLIGSPMRGVEGIVKCSCDCHRKSDVQKA